jgi:hypothetical protein
MGNIYKSAERVIVWLGHAFANSNLALSQLAKFGTQIVVTRSLLWVPSPENKTGIRGILANPNLDQHIWEAINKLTCVSWFQRLWIVQEVHSATPESVLICGQDQIMWPLFRRACFYLNLNDHVPSKIRNGLKPVRALCNWDPIQGFPNLLSYTRGHLCSEPVDKIYGLLSLAGSVASQIHPDYSDSHSEVYKKTFLAYTNSVQRLDLIGQCDIKYRLSVGPSWVPDYSKPLPARELYHGGYFASGFSRAYVEYKPPGSLDVLGIRCAIVSTVTESIQDTMDLVNLICKIDIEELETRSYPIGETLIAAYAWTFSCGMLAESRPQDPMFPKLEKVKDIIRTIALRGLNIKKDESLLEEFKTHGSKGLLIGRKVFTTTGDYIGFGPGDSRPGK